MNEQLPTKDNFVSHGTLDELNAWENFGGLTLSAAHARFRENPNFYLEDFMWMGNHAFAYYFPIISRFVIDSLNSSKNEPPYELGTVASCISMQLSEKTNTLSSELIDELRKLAEIVILKVGRCDAFDSQHLTPRQAFVLEWQHLLDALPSA